ncbi:hypothetical protein [Photorhabdus heterorhabditis]|uniref:hypothetical protein n=1 Tax=Photorhabdus heterorhabditis TaxID=880156 RepID=UPI001F1CE9A7|nr:hypothetical protein [Photorhabdus heterorhabditis]
MAEATLAGHQAGIDRRQLPAAGDTQNGHPEAGWRRENPGYPDGDGQAHSAGG